MPPSLGKMRRRPAAVAAALTLILVAGSCAGHDTKGAQGGSSTSTSAVARGAGGAGPNGFVPTPIAWKRCGQDDCATVTAPLDYSKPDGATIHLAVLRAAATGPRQGALFVNPGGPGGSATEFAAQLPLILPRSITEHFDIVGVDPRGVGDSAPFDCAADYTALYRVDPTVETPEDRATLVANAKGLDASCQQHAGTVLAHVGTRDDARDIDTVRAAMGDPQLSFFGGSYGTVNGQVYADLFPSHVKAMVLDGIVELGPSGLDLATEQAAGFEVALQRFVDHCTSSGQCRNANPLAAVVQVQALAEQPGGIPARRAD
ncbi:MAG: alpha/beta hydrolase, partial [Acidimicrobiales bacterium]|nr:alpha/beta hydrolase [Acidimicrobiales bacterium]